MRVKSSVPLISDIPSLRRVFVEYITFRLKSFVFFCFASLHLLSSFLLVLIMYYYRNLNE